jgi:ketosteroid isomerase-like protein
MADDVEWNEPPSGVAPFAGTRRGRDQVAAFFQSLGEQAEPLEFEPREFIAHGDRVIALGHYRFRARPTGKTWETDWVMVWTLAAGKVRRFQIYKDSAAEVAAFQA